MTPYRFRKVLPRSERWRKNSKFFEKMLAKLAPASIMIFVDISVLFFF